MLRIEKIKGQKVLKIKNEKKIESLKICLSKKIGLKVIPLKLFYYQTFVETWHNQHS